MAKIYKLFSTREDSPASHTFETASRSLPVIKRITEEAVTESERLATKMSLLTKDSPKYRQLSRAYDEVIMRWVERVHRLGALAKGLWLVDFDTGSGYYCWAYPEEKIEYFHSYEGGFKSRRRIDSAEQKSL